MPKQTIRSVRAEMQEKIDRAIKDRDIAREQRDRAVAGLEALAKAERDVLAGFIMREIPVKLADLPAPITKALGIMV